MAKKTYNEKLEYSGDLPKVEKTDKGSIVIVPAVEYDALMKKVPKGKIITIDRMMGHFAAKYKASRACPMTAGIFVNISAHASEERLGKKATPWWRTLKKDGQLNEKFPDGIEGQKTRLEAEGHTIIQKGKRFLVENYEKKLYNPVL